MCLLRLGVFKHVSGRPVEATSAVVVNVVVFEMLRAGSPQLGDEDYMLQVVCKLLLLTQRKISVALLPVTQWTARFKACTPLRAQRHLQKHG
jgi:hypothetical protein